MRRTHCGSCGSTSINDFLTLAPTPLADSFPTSPDTEVRRYPLGAALCYTCSLVQLTEVVPDHLLWAGDYGFFTGTSPSAVTYFADYAGDLIDLMAAQHGVAGREPFVVEVACNDGTMLRHFATGHRVLGVEPAKGPADAARALGPPVVGDLFTEEVAHRIVAEHGRADLVIANNVLAHVSNLNDFVAGLSVLLAPGGVLAIEVQYLADLVLGNQFDHLYHEHRSFFSLQSLDYLLTQHNLPIMRVQRVAGQGGSLRVLAGGVSSDGSVTDLMPAERWLDDRQLWSLQDRCDAIRERILELVATERAVGRTVAGYGASAKSCTMLNFLGLGPKDLQYVVDTTPAKIGRYTPGTGIPIIENPTMDPGRTTFLLLVHNYLPGVLRRERWFLDAGGRFVVPLPVPVVI